jgi:hypothetical protein
MKAEPLKVSDDGPGYTPCEPHEATHLRICPPGPYANRVLPVMIGGTRKGTPNWTWNGDVEKPTLKPSILTNGSEGMPRCHSFVTDGKIKFLNDCDHELAGQTLDLEEID